MSNILTGLLFIYSSIALPPRSLLHSTKESSTQMKLITVILVAVRSEIIKHRFVVIHSYTYSSERSGGTLAVRHVNTSNPGIRQHLCFLTGRVTAEVFTHRGFPTIQGYTSSCKDKASQKRMDPDRNYLFQNNKRLGSVNTTHKRQ